MPKGIEIDPKELEEKIKKAVNPEKIVKQPIAFGLVAFFVEKIIEEKEGELENLEKKIKEIEGVSSIEVLNIIRLL